MVTSSENQQIIPTYSLPTTLYLLVFYRGHMAIPYVENYQKFQTKCFLQHFSDKLKKFLPTYVQIAKNAKRLLNPNARNYVF